ncbi:MAG TPA: kelch repeat-containing protein [Terriglobales bacterium]|jgi:N-acetylneuraminic acid mutarotase|nr:kelch repeat-containing protein [Terriglobales bacterium]
MKTLVSALALFLFLLAVSLQAAEEPKLSPLPIALSNNAVAITHAGKESRIFSFMGIGAKKTWDAVTSRVFALDLPTGKWTEIRAVPGAVGRIAASAASLKDQIVLMGGYIVDDQGAETTVADVNILYPDEGRWYRGEDMPTPVDDSVTGVYRERYVYLIGGWSKADATRKVQVYDTEKNHWSEATPLPGTPVFGHAGTLVGDTIVYIDGAYKNPSGANPKYVASSECWMGKIAKGDPAKIEWTKLPEHPGHARYRIAAGAAEKDSRIYFTGGTDNPYNYNGIGYNGQPSEPSPATFAFNLKSGKWETINENTPDQVMDQHTLLVTHRGLITVGGMEKGQTVTAKVGIVKSSPAK